jgi:hypothetical protein
MVRTTIVFGLLWIALGAGHYYAVEEQHWMSLLFAAMGLAMLVLGLVAIRASWRKNAMHAAVALGVAGLLVTVQALVQLVQLVFSKPGLFVQSVMSLLCGAFVVLAVKSFIDARRNRPPAEIQPPVEQQPEQRG